MPHSPKRACPRCRRLNCTDPTHKPKQAKPFASARETKQRRPDYAADRKRRREYVKATLRSEGERLDDGKWMAQCHVCGQVKTLSLRSWWADHVTPVAQGGSEDGPLRLSCEQCQRRQAALVANKRRVQSKTHTMRRTPRS